MAMPMTDNANYHVLAYIAYREGYAAATTGPANPWHPWHRTQNPYNRASMAPSPLAMAWDQGLVRAIDDLLLGLDNPADLHNALRRIFGE